MLVQYAVHMYRQDMKHSSRVQQQRLLRSIHHIWISTCNIWHRKTPLHDKSIRYAIAQGHQSAPEAVTLCMSRTDASCNTICSDGVILCENFEDHTTANNQEDRCTLRHTACDWDVTESNLVITLVICLRLRQGIFLQFFSTELHQVLDVCVTGRGCLGWILDLNTIRYLL